MGAGCWNEWDDIYVLMQHGRYFEPGRIGILGGATFGGRDLQNNNCHSVDKNLRVCRHVKKVNGNK